ncbi:unnamed protein product [Caenorhabditis auriculariae]|uniref:VWFA domain-containing protein n=1 Tax=Caenorhabditis auriculariae TaxID=2777116 RepID=A0A8S1H710_9PELO|nr:unnamed protein product [Caenorhabditis auriculariae]
MARNAHVVRCICRTQTLNSQEKRQERARPSGGHPAGNAAKNNLISLTSNTRVDISSDIRRTNNLCPWHQTMTDTCSKILGVERESPTGRKQTVPCEKFEKGLASMREISSFITSLAILISTVEGFGAPGFVPPENFVAERWYPSNLPTVMPPWKMPGADINQFRTTRISTTKAPATSTPTPTALTSAIPFNNGTTDASLIELMADITTSSLNQSLLNEFLDDNENPQDGNDINSLSTTISSSNEPFVERKSSIEPVTENAPTPVTFESFNNGTVFDVTPSSESIFFEERKEETKVDENLLQEIKEIQSEKVEETTTKKPLIEPTGEGSGFEMETKLEESINGTTVCKDILFLLDSSGNVEQQYTKQKRFIEDIVAKVAGIKERKLALITYSGRSRQRVNLPFSKEPNLPKFLQKLRKARFLRGVTATGSAISATTDFAIRHGGNMQVVVVTDGFSFDEVSLKSEALRSIEGVETFATGQYFPVVRDVLLAIAGSSENVFFERKTIPRLIEKLSC